MWCEFGDSLLLTVVVQGGYVSYYGWNFLSPEGQLEPIWACLSSLSY